jgi:flotillin
MSRMGLVLDTLKIQNVTDEVNYLSSIGRIRGASLNQMQAIAEAEARADAAVQKAANWGASEVAKVDADLGVARQETAKRIADARSRREAMIQESRGQVAALVAQAKAEIERQRARALQEKRRLDADVVAPSLAYQRAAEEGARGDAAALLERGRAEAESLRKLVEAYRAGGAGARDVLALQTLLPLLSEIAGAQHSLSIGRLTVLPTSDSAGAGLSRAAIGVSEQVRAATGVDLGRLVQKMGGQT